MSDLGRGASRKVLTNVLAGLNWVQNRKHAHCAACYFCLYFCVLRAFSWNICIL